MKSLKIWSLIVLFAMSMSGCEKVNNDDTGGNDTKLGNFDTIEQEWKLVSVDGVANDFHVYISFVNGGFIMYQQVYTLNFLVYEGSYSVSGNTLSGTYADGSAWKCDYTGGIASDGKSMTLKSKEDIAVTYVYEACSIPYEVIDEATTRAIEVVPFL